MTKTGARSRTPTGTIEHPTFESEGAIRYGLFTRAGGVSDGVFQSLNCGFGSGDDLEAVRENRSRAAQHLGVAAQALCTPYQSHSDQALVVDEPWPPDDAPKADALVTRRPGIAIGVLTADCAPVLLVDPEVPVVGVAHAGWRGALGGILEAALAAMIGEGARPERIAALIGPCIGRDSYEVGPEFHARFLAEDPGNEGFFRPARRAEHHLFDLAAYVAGRLTGQGIAAVAATERDTFSDDLRFFSYRRSQRQGAPGYGRLLSAITLAE
ncbi:MAG: peptidoglycan editing factor PgeF [Alphaproteobacteria bacterium]